MLCYNTVIQVYINGGENLKKSDKQSTTQIKAKDLARISLFAVIIGICAWICIPSVVPFTMQTFGAFLNFGVLRGKKGTCAVCLYILLGIFGIPVFNGGSSGIGVVLGKTGGYMIGWIFAGLLIWGTDIFLKF